VPKRLKLCLKEEYKKKGSNRSSRPTNEYRKRKGKQQPKTANNRKELYEQQGED
jgi:hypothetical protein